jgi:hypothetical protein
MLKRAACGLLCALVPFASAGRLLAQGTSDPIWGLYASYVGSPPLWADPCNITYTISPIDSAIVIKNVELKLMIPIMEGVPRSEAQKGMKMYGKYFDDLPDGIVKMTSCSSATPPAGTPPPTRGGGSPSACPDGSSRRDQTILVAEAYGSAGGGTDPYQSASVRACIEPDQIAWIAWNVSPELSADGQLGGGGSVDDWIDLTVKSPSGKSTSCRLDQNDAFGAPVGAQHVIFGKNAESPDVYRKVPFGPRAGQVLALDESGAIPTLPADTGIYAFTFQFRDNTGGNGPHGHPRIYLLIKNRSGDQQQDARSTANPGGPNVRVRFQGALYETLYEQSVSDGLPLDLYYYPVNLPDGNQVAQDGGKLWGRFARKPAADYRGPAPTEWWHVTWVKKGDRWESVQTRIAGFEVVK